MKKITLSLVLVLCSVFVFGQWDITRRTVYCDSLKPRGDFIYINGDTTLQDYIANYSAATAAAAGVTGNIQFNTGGVLDASSNLSWNDTTLYLNDGLRNIAIGGVPETIPLVVNTYNLLLGYNTGNAITGQNNILLGHYTGDSITTGDNNVFIGNYSGLSSKTSTGNIFLGYNSGFNETGSNKLYIENSNSVSPLIYGEFDNDSIVINGSTRITGSLDVGGPIISSSAVHAFVYFGDSTVIYTFAVADTWYQLTNATNNIFICEEVENFVCSGDTLYPEISGDYDLRAKFLGEGTAGISYAARFYNVTQSKPYPIAGVVTGDGTNDKVSLPIEAYAEDVDAGDAIIIQFKNLTGTQDFELNSGIIKSYLIHR